MSKKHLGILIGRFQPFHLGHAALIEAALSQCDALLIAIGSAERARSFKNPWTFDERKALIEKHFAKAPLFFAAIPDFFYAERAWIQAIENSACALNPASVTLFGHDKDASTYYLKEFPEWRYQELPNFKGINATHIRATYFLEGTIPQTQIPPSTDSFLTVFKNESEFERLEEEAKFVRDYQYSWRHSPYPPIFVTTDALVTCEKHVLLIQRKFCPGKGLYALPGGFLEKQEWIQNGLIRELIEETSLNLSSDNLLRYLKSSRVFDYPDRSQIGRVITHVGHFDLPGPRPTIQASDDALSVEWIPFSQLEGLKENFHDDHYQMIQAMLFWNQA